MAPRTVAMHTRPRVSSRAHSVSISALLGAVMLDELVLVADEKESTRCARRERAVASGVVGRGTPSIVDVGGLLASVLAASSAADVGLDDASVAVDAAPSEHDSLRAACVARGESAGVPAGGPVGR